MKKHRKCHSIQDLFLDEEPKENFCYFPFYQLTLLPNGNISPCCWNPEYSLGNIKESTIEEIWNNKKSQSLRQEFLESNPKTCEKQMLHKGCYRNSHRDYLKSSELKVVQDVLPRRFDVRLNGKCNLECVMCSVWKDPNGIYNETEFWKEGKSKFFPYIKEIDVVGGEPFIQADTYRLIQEIHEVNAHCQWAFVTNGNYRFNETITRYLDKIAIRWINLSLDSVVPETYSKIRINGKLERTIATLNGLLEYQKKRLKIGQGFQLTVSMCVQVLNWREIGTFLNFVLKNSPAMPLLQFASVPTQASILSLPKIERRKVLNYLFNLRGTYSIDLLQPIYAPLRDSLKA